MNVSKLVIAVFSSALALSAIAQPSPPHEDGQIKTKVTDKQHQGDGKSMTTTLGK